MGSAASSRGPGSAWPPRYLDQAGRDPASQPVPGPRSGHRTDARRDRTRLRRGRCCVVIFIDSNVPMYLIGADHPLKDRARRLIEDAVVSGDVLSSSAEVLQELLHRYAVIGRREFIEPAFDALSSLTDVIYSITAADVDRARRLLA